MGRFHHDCISVEEEFGATLSTPVIRRSTLLEPSIYKISIWNGRNGGGRVVP